MVFYFICYICIYFIVLLIEKKKMFVTMCSSHASTLQFFRIIENLIIYFQLNDVHAGGYTVFPLLDVKIIPQRVGVESLQIT